ncbi:putative ribosomal protein S1 [Lupinus albus]|uniref:Putative ribosomal protein S1 n=1 Tax=Lupinus albus TaxID=3870 RepID=A0A6A4PI42_LUPAL|nr:putative ribosomal protein S1 [Lupinus albus]
MPNIIFTASTFLTLSQSSQLPSSLSLFSFPFSKHAHQLFVKLPLSHSTTKLLSSPNDTHIIEDNSTPMLHHFAPSHSNLQSQISADWKVAKAYKDRGVIYNGIVEGFNGGGLIVRFYSLMGFLPYPRLSPSHSCKEPEKTIREIAEGLLYSLISVKVIEADEDQRNLLFSEKEASWSRYSEQVKVGDIFEARVSSIEDYGAFVDLRFPDGLYHLHGLVHISELSWDRVDSVRDILTECDEMRVKVVGVDREKSRISLSIKQLEDPLLENMDIVQPQDGLLCPNSSGGGDSSGIPPLPRHERILEEHLQEDGIYDASIRRQGYEKWVVSQESQLSLSNEPPTNQQYNLLVQAGRQISADWQIAKAYKDRGAIYNGIVEGFNGGGLMVRFYSLMGFLPFPLLSPSHSCKEPKKTIQEIAEGLLYSSISVKVIEADEGQQSLMFSEKEASWSRYSKQVKVGDIFEAKVSCIEEYGAFVDLRFPDGLYHLHGLIHISEMSWDLVDNVRDILTECDVVRVKVVRVDREKSRISLSIKRLEEDPFVQNLGTVVPQNGLACHNSRGGGNRSGILPLPGLERILEELLQEDGIDDARIRRHGFEKRAVSRDLQIWLSDERPTNRRINLLARAGKQMQEIQLITSLDQEGIQRALQRVFERIP